MSARSSYPKSKQTQSLSRHYDSVHGHDHKYSTHHPGLGDAHLTGADQLDLPVQRAAYLTTSEAASYLRVSKQFLEIARHRGDGPPYIKLARAVRYHRPSLDRWMLKRQRNHTAEENSYE